MANYQLLKADIDEKVYQNGLQEITGENLNYVLNAMVTTLGAEYQFAGVATIGTNPGTPDAKVFYIANGKGTYTKFGSLEVTEDEVVVLYWDTAWHKEATGIASQAKLTELDQIAKRNEYNIKAQCISRQLKNLYDKDSPFIVHGKCLNILDGKEIVSERFSISDYIPVEPNTTYTRGSSYGYQNQMCFYDENGAFISGDEGGNGYNLTFQTPANCRYLRITTEDARSGYYLNLGNSTEYTPFYFILDNEKISERIDKSKLDTSLVTGIETENLYNKDTLVVGHYIDGNGDLSPASGFNATDYIPVEPNTIYTIFTDYNALENSAFYNQNKEKISLFNEYTTNYYKRITTPANCHYIRCSIKDANKNVVMIYKGEEYRKSYPYGPLLKLSGIDIPNNIIFISQNGRGK